ncbi:Ni,Fe-hydrogenase maturation factor [Bradyrhizobium diazoefficiens]|uniref:HupD protein homolog, hupD N-terminal n=1 Tax=Bradyrhizobium diazoefficiens TaxID=1355477 RepID=A0A0E4BMU5_9BRAD|nr:hypothetical protein [Bradyrhizobium diazoefficiens]MBR0893293.1 hypothetical protein [Bradyrhizobium diazoefficiens]MBR0924957.1 hypothetical protein [Bradyrhizobium diazoefficiens]BAR56171.1 HupD protein homolog, hupD N-terminal [Bradyrhizobium diazoefficiens]
MLNSTEKKRILVLGIGDILWADEGFGAVEEFHRRYAVDDNVTVPMAAPRGSTSLARSIHESTVVLDV